jgi:hypothetical protein
MSCTAALRARYDGTIPHPPGSAVRASVGQPRTACSHGQSVLPVFRGAQCPADCARIHTLTHNNI